MAAAHGNQYAAKERLWRAAILRALEQRSRADQVAELDKIAASMLDKAKDGDMAAIKELGDRLDGKAPQGVELSGPDGGDIPAKVVVEFVGTKSPVP